MRSFTEYIIDYADGNLSEIDRKKFENELMHNPELKKEYELFILVNEVMQGKIDIDDINNDDDLSNADREAKILVTEFKKDPTKFSKIQNFVEDSLINNEDQEVMNELDQINKEIKDKNINSITQEWVNEWNNGVSNSKQEKIRSFVSTSLNENNSKPLNLNTYNIPWYKSTMVRIVSLSAAATLAIILVIRSLVAPVSPELLYELNYKPYQAITSITRGNNISLNEMYNQAIVNYRQGNFEIAALEFDLLMKTDTFDVTPRFFAGLSNIELGNYSKAISLLTEVTNNNADYKVESQWYIGLTYLKTGDSANAILIFENLSRTQGYFQKPAKKILRKLQ